MWNIASLGAQDDSQVEYGFVELLIYLVYVDITS